MTPVPVSALPRLTPESQGIPSSAVLRFVEALESRVGERAAVHSMMLLRHGCVIAEGWWAPYTAQQPHLLFSLSKSFTATAVGLAVAEGRLSLDDPVASFFPDAAAHSDGLAALRVRHLLSMSTGQAADTWSFMVDRADGDWIAGFLGVPIVHPPGTQFLYNTGATYMLSAIVQQVTGLKLVDYLQPRLFAPLGIENAAWTESPQAITAGGIGLSLTTEDVARFGQLYLQKGVWHGTPIVPETWVGQATAFQIANSGGMQPDWTQGYGYQFWRCRHNAYRGDGVFGQYCIVMPEQDAVLAITAGLDVFAMQQPLDHVWEILLPAMGAARIADDPAAHAALTAKLAHLSLPPVTGARTSSAVAQVSGRAYAVEANPLGIGTLLFDFAADACTLHIGTAAGEHVIAIGYGGWRAGGPTALFQQPLLFERTPVAVSGAWTAEDVFTVIVHLTATPFCYTLTCQFSGDSVLIEKVISVSLDSMEPLLLLGTLERPAQR